MRKIDYTKQFKKDYKHEKRGLHSKEIDNLFSEVLQLLANDKPLSHKLCDHSLTGKWKGFSDCHVKPDLVLIYKKTQDKSLELIRLGSHSELGF